MRSELFKSQLAGLGECFREEITEGLALGYWKKLKHLTDEQFIASVDIWLEEGRWFPRIVNLLENAPKPKMIENKGSLSWCENTQKLLDTYQEIPNGN